MATVKYNVYYSTSPSGPWTKANSAPIEKSSPGNSYTIENLTPGTQYYFTVVGGVEIGGTFYEQLSQAIGPNEMKARGIENLNIVPTSVRTLSIKTHGGGGLSHRFTIT